MNNLTVQVKIWGNPVGTLYWDQRQEVAVFEYEPSWLRWGMNLSPLMLPLRPTPFSFVGNRNACFSGLPGMMADSLPDKFGTQLINEWAMAQGKSPEEITPLDRLCYVGQRGMGALEYEPAIGKGNRSSRVYVDELAALAGEVFENRLAFQEKLLREDKAILEILNIGTSAGGAKPKAIIAWNRETNEVRSGQVTAEEGFSYWILKFDGTAYEEHNRITKNPHGIGNIEYAYYKMAVACGIDMSESMLLKEGEQHHFITKRFDRKEDGSKLHMQTLAGLAHLDRDARHSYEEAFATIRAMNLPYVQQEEFYRRMVFNIVARNHDDHTKNHSFLMDERGNWRLAPAYDICYSYSPTGRWTAQHQLSLRGKQSGFTHEDLMRSGEREGIKNPAAIIEQVVEVIGRWKEFAKEAGVKEGHIKTIGENLLLLTPRSIYAMNSPKKQQESHLSI